MEPPKGISSFEFRRMVKNVCLHLKEGIELGFFELRVSGEVSKGKHKIQVRFSPIEQHMISEDEGHE